MKNLRKRQLIAIGSSIAVLYGVLCLVAFASATSRTEKPAPVDAEQYADFMGHEVLDIQDLAEGAEVQRRMFNRITPPGLSWTQPMFPPVAPFDAQYFDEQFLEGLLGEGKNSVVIYPLSLMQDPKTRETLIYNAEGELIAAIPADCGSREWPADADPSRVILQLDLLPAEDVEPYLYTERRIEETLARHNASRLAKSGGAANRGLEAGEFGFVDMQILSNGNVQLTVTNGADVVEVFAYTVWHTSSVVVVTWTNEQSNVVTDTNTVWHQVSPAFNGLESAWECLATNLVLTNGVGIYEDANISSNARIRFYAVANRQDTDGDGLTDGMEIFVHHTNPGNPDTDGDGWSDAEELAAETEPLDRFSATKLARDVVLNEVLYNATGPDLGYEWIELYCAGRYPVNLGNFVIQVADTAYSNAYVFPSNTWIEPGRFLLLGGSNVPNRDLEVNFRMPNRFTNDPTAAVRIVAETGTNTVVVDCLMYGGSASNFNPYGLDTTGWISSNALSAGAGRSLYRRFNGHDTDQVWDWWYTENPTPNPFADISDSDGDGLTDEEELTGSRNPYGEPTNPHNADSDGDGLSDYAECITHGTNPNTWATDDDIYPWPPPSGAASDWWGSDSYEIANGWNPLNPDENTNGIPDSWEMAFPGTNLYGHADNDGISNFDELMQNSDPNDPNSATSQPYVLRYEPSMPGWANDGMKDIGLRGWVKIHFEDLKTNLDLCVWVQEGRTQEQFRVEWRGATQKGIHWLSDQEVVTSASAEANTQPYLFVQDLGQRPDFTNTPGGEYKIVVISIESVELVGAPFDGLVVKNGNVVTMKANILPTSYVPPANEPKWYYQQLKTDGSWEAWTSFGSTAHGKTYAHTTTMSGVFRVKTVLTVCDSVLCEKILERTADEADGYGKVGDPDAFGVTDTQIQIDIRDAAKGFLGSTAYPYDGVVTAQYGFPEYPANTYKCNIFVAHRAKQAGADVPAINGIPATYPPLANEWAGTEDTHPFIPGFQTDIDHWTLLITSYPQPGFIVGHPNASGSGHVGIVDYDGHGIGAGSVSGTVNKKYGLFLDGTSGFRKYEP